MSSDWNMPRSAESCQACGRAFASGDALQAYLFAALPGYERRDYCPSCRPTDAERSVASWRTHRPQPHVRRTAVFDREAVVGLFERLADQPGLEAQQLRFVISLLLWRKKVLKFVGVDETSHGEVWEFTQPGGGSAVRLERPDLDEEELERLSIQLEQIISGHDAQHFPESVHDPR